MIGRHQQTGLSLIELMIGMVLASLIIAGVLYVFNGSRASSLLIEAESKMLDEAQFSMENLGSVIRMAGYTMDPKAGGSESILIDPANPVPGDVIQGVEGVDEADQITVWYEGNDDGSVFDCLGNSVFANADNSSILMSNTYFVNDEGALSCKREIINDPTNPAPTTQPLINDVANLQILYGIDTDATPDGAVNQYKKFDAISVDERLRIVAVMLELTLEAMITGDRMEKKFTSAIHLRNRTL